MAEGGQPRSITDSALYKLFPHDGQLGVDYRFPDGTELIHAPDYERADEFQLVATGDGLYMIYPCDCADWHCIRYDYGLQAWTYDRYGDGGVNSIHFARGAGVYKILVGTENGTLGYLSGLMDVEDYIDSEVHTQSLSGRNFRSKQRFGDLTLNMDSQGGDVTVTPYVDYYQTAESGAVISALTRQEKIVNLENGDELFGQNLGIVITHPGKYVTPAGTNPVQLKLYAWQLDMVEKPEISNLRATDWQEVGAGGSRFVQGVHIQADTFGQDFPIRIEYDGGQLGGTLTINHDGQIEEDYSFDQPFEAHLVRVLPTDTNKNWRLFKLEWISEPTPATAKVWQTQKTDHGTCGWKHIPRAYICYASASEVDFSMITESGTYTYTLPANGNVKDKYPLRLRAVKGKIFAYRLESATDFQLFVQETCLFIAPWGRGLESEYGVDKPFGGASRESGALI